MLRRTLIISGLLAALAPSMAGADLLSSADRQIYRSAYAAARGGNWPAAERQAEQAAEKLPGKVLHWLALTRGNTGARFSEIADFIARNPEWPAQIALRQRAEEATAGVPDATLRDWFERFHPVTPYGRLRQADLMMSGGQQAAAVAQIRDVWVNGDLTAFDEKSVLQRYPGLIRGEDHLKRLDRLLWDGLAEAARRMLPHVPADYRLLADARIKLAAFQPGVERAVARVPQRLQSDPGLLYERLRWRRRKEAWDAALDILGNPPRDLVRPAAWWTERQILARHALADGKATLAYRLVTKHGLSEGPAHAEAEFLAGWIALRFLHDANAAYDHFVRLYGAVKLPISVARGAYWAGRAAEELDFKQLAASWYATAAEQQTTYYGQIAAARTGDPAAARLPVEPKPLPDEAARFQRRELVRAVLMLSEIGDSDHIAIFMHRLSEVATAPSEHALIAGLAEAIGRLDLSVSAAKRAGYAGVALVSHGYPLIELPKGDEVERPLVLAMTRQESAFEREAVSRSGARGLMQLMPGTASHLAKARQIPYSADRLLTDGRYNLMLGRAYLEELLERFDGSYVLTIASYNAGPARVRQWIDNFGDPRTKAIDVVDWVESIPFAETRNYVQRVLENLQVYRMRLGDHALAFTLVSDLKR